MNMFSHIYLGELVMPSTCQIFQVEKWAINPHHLLCHYQERDACYHGSPQAFLSISMWYKICHMYRPPTADIFLLIAQSVPTTITMGWLTCRFLALVFHLVYERQCKSSTRLLVSMAWLLACDDHDHDSTRAFELPMCRAGTQHNIAKILAISSRYTCRI